MQGPVREGMHPEQQEEEQQQHGDPLEVVCGGGGAAAAAAAGAGVGGAAEGDGVQLMSFVSGSGSSGVRPVPLDAPDCSRAFQASGESPCSILFSGPQLFNVTAEAE